MRIRDDGLSVEELLALRRDLYRAAFANGITLPSETKRRRYRMGFAEDDCLDLDGGVTAAFDQVYKEEAAVSLCLTELGS